jgi:hypothetical protein
MPDPRPGKPTPEDPRNDTPIKDPPVNPEHDVDEPEPVREAGGDRVLYDENRVPG